MSKELQPLSCNINFVFTARFLSHFIDFLEMDIELLDPEYSSYTVDKQKLESLVSILKKPRISYLELPVSFHKHVEDFIDNMLDDYFDTFKKENV